MKKQLLYTIALLMCFSFRSFIFAENVRKISLYDYQKIALDNNNEIYRLMMEAEAAKAKSSFMTTKYFPTIFAIGGIIDTNIGNDSLKVNTDGLTIPPIMPHIKDLVGNNRKGASIISLNITQTLFAGGRIFNGNKLAKTGIEVASLKLQMKRNEIFTQAQQKYYKVFLLQEELKTLASYKNTLNALSSQVGQSYKNGIVSKSDYLRVEFKREEIIVKENNLQKMIKIAEKDLKLFAGIKDSYSIEVDGNFYPVENPDFDTNNFTARLKKRSEHQLLEANVKAAKLRKDIAVGAYLPSILVGASLYRMDYLCDEQSKASLQDAAVYAMVRIPISLWETTYNAREQDYEYKSAQEQLNFANDYLLLDMESKLAQLQTSYEQVGVAQTGLSFAEANKREHKDRYKSGVCALTDYLEALSLEQENITKLNKAKVDYLQAKVDFLISIAVEAS